MLNFLRNPPHYLFFTGKGGVGKTSLACAAALALADRGRSVLLVSTDPASNLDEMLDQKLSSQPSPVRGARGLSALNIDPTAAAEAYRTLYRKNGYPAFDEAPIAAGAARRSSVVKDQVLDGRRGAAR